MNNAARQQSKRRSREAIPVHPSVGNVFADLGFPESAVALAKAGIAARIASTIEGRALTQVRAAELLGVSQADVSDLVRGKLIGFSTERLFRFLNALGQDIDILIREGPSTRAGYLRVSSADLRSDTSTRRAKR